MRCFLGMCLFLSFFACAHTLDKLNTPIRIAIESEPASLDPRMAMDAYSAKLNELIYRGLFTYDESLQLVPDLVSSYQMLSPTQFRFTLKSGESFQDGSPITANDVIYTYRSLLDPARKSPQREGFKMIQSIDGLSSTQFEITLNEAYAPFLNRLTLGIIPARYGDLPDFAHHPVGSGAFQLIEWERGQYLRLKPKPPAARGYRPLTPKFRGAGVTTPDRVWDGVPNIEFWILPDENLRILELLHGRMDLVQNGISPALLPVVERSPDIEVQKAPGINLAYLGFQLADPILSKREVRAAIAHAIDRRKLIDLQLRGTARVADSPLSPDNWAYAQGLSAVDYNPDLAKRLLDRAGFPDPDDDGPLPRFHLTYKTSVQKDRIEMALLVAEFLKAVGIEVSVESREWGTFFQDIQNGRFQLFSLTWVGIVDPDILYYMFDSQSVPPKGGNRGHYLSSEVDAAVEAARRSYDPDERKRLYAKVQQKVVEDFPYVLLWDEDTIAAHRKDLCGYRLWPNASFKSLVDVYRGKCISD